MRHLILAVLCVPLLACESLQSSPVVLSSEFNGWGYLWADGAHAVALGEGAMEVAVGSKGYAPFMGWKPVVQEGDYLLIGVNGSSHHPYAKPLPAWAKDLIPDEDVRILRARGIVLTFAAPEPEAQPDA